MLCPFHSCSTLLFKLTSSLARPFVHFLAAFFLCRPCYHSSSLLFLCFFSKFSLNVEVFFAAYELAVVMAGLRSEDLREDLREVFENAVLLGSSDYLTPTQTYCIHDAALPVSTSTIPGTIPYFVSSSVYSSTRILQKNETIDYFANDAGYFEAEASKDFWSEFYPETAMDQRGIDEINQEVDDDQMGRPVMDSRKRHKGLLGGVTGCSPIWGMFWTPMISTLVPLTSREKTFTF